MHITLLEPFFTGSHKSWALGLRNNLNFKLEILSLEGRFWKWRMHGGAISLAEKFKKRGNKTDLLLATDMLDLSVFLSLTRNETSGIPVGIYFHENQITYPWSPNDTDVLEKRDLHYGFINYSSALIADQVYFNSNFHMNSFLKGLEDFLKSFPDNQEKHLVESIFKKSKVLHLGVDLKRFDQYKELQHHKPLILWNHRWEYDKNPELFFHTLHNLSKKGLDFDLCVLGQKGEKYPEIFKRLPEMFDEKLIHIGEVKSFEEYAKWLWRATIHPTTSNQDFFGISVVEGLYCECTPLLPNRLAYPEHFNDSNSFFESESEFESKLSDLIQGNTKLNSYREEVIRYDWSNQIKHYEKSFADLIT